MAKAVMVNITSHPLSREEHGVVFKITDGNSKFGELIVSKGAFGGSRRGNKTTISLVGRVRRCSAYLSKEMNERALGACSGSGDRKKRRTKCAVIDWHPSLLRLQQLGSRL
jgi:hypothetical protein